MPHFKAPGGQLMFLDSEEFAHLLPEGSVEITDEQAAAMRPVGDPVAEVEVALQVEMDRLAKAHGYDSILSACSYAAQPAGAPFQAEGAAFLAWRSAVWSQAYKVLAEVQSGRRVPTSAEAVASMPPFVFP